MTDLALLALLALVGMLWFESRRVQEAAVARCRQACQAAGVQFLDDIAPVWRVRLVRDESGSLRLRRVFTFDYSTPSGERRSGIIVMLGRRPIALELEPTGGRSDR